MSYIFYERYNLISLPNIHLTNTKNVTNMSYMFAGCSKLSDIPNLKWNK